MKKVLISLLVILVLVPISACTNSQGSNTQAATIIFDYSIGSPKEDILTQTYKFSGGVTVEEVCKTMSEVSGLDFLVTLSEGEGGYIADWSPNSTLIAGLDDREQKKEFTFFDADSMRWFMLDSFWRTLKELYPAQEIYYTMDGGKELRFDELYPVSAFPADTPYMGSAFYFSCEEAGIDIDTYFGDF